MKIVLAAALLLALPCFTGCESDQVTLARINLKSEEEKRQHELQMEQMKQTHEIMKKQMDQTQERQLRAMEAQQGSRKPETKDKN